ncbi:MAG: polyprenyl synthetase family protein [Gemmatimonadaceae bacterium]
MAEVVRDLTRLVQNRERVDSALRQLADQELGDLRGEVAEAMRYALAGSGKRLRGALLLAVYEACGGTQDASHLAACVEVVHAYSLVHDDLPSMDNAVIRRGRAAVHAAHGAATATRAGVALVPIAARSAYRAARGLDLTSAEALAIVRELMAASGATGMVGGQWLDLEAEGRTLHIVDLERVHRMKTGALLRACARIGAMAARAGSETVSAFDRFGSELGLAFQIADDVLDATQRSDVLGKSSGSDAVRGKSTYVGLLGVAASRARARSHADAALAAVDAAPGAGARETLTALARYAVERHT